MDIDNFKGVNDTYEHESGDITLKAVVKEVERELPEGAFIGRFGGDEFMVLFCHENYHEVENSIQRIMEKIQQLTIQYESVKFSITISFGVVCRRDEDTNIDDMITRCDRALYKAKHDGRNRSVIELCYKNYCQIS